MSKVDDCAREAVMVKGDASNLPTAEKVVVKGFNWDDPDNVLADGGIDYKKMLDAYVTTGFQSTNMGLAINEINRMIDHKLTGEYPENFDMEEFDCGTFTRPKSPCTIFYSFTSNLISSGARDTIHYLCKHNMVDVVITTAGGIEEDFIKVLADTYMGSFSLDGKKLRENGMNRIANLIVPNDNYCKFENWILPIFEVMADMQDKQGIVWTPCAMIHHLGMEIGKLPRGEESVWYWCYKNKIPVFSPAITDGSLGDMLYFFSYKRRLNVEIVQDLRLLNSISTRSAASGMIICGGGLIKHHTCNANLMRNGAEYAVYINTATDFDGSDSGASPDEAISWGKIRITAQPVKVVCEVTLILPLIVGKTFYEAAKKYIEFHNRTKVQMIKK